MFRKLSFAMPVATLALVFASTHAAAAATTLLLHSAKSVDINAHTVVLPLHQGTSNGHTVWYILTDVSDPAVARRRRRRSRSSAKRARRTHK